MVFSGEPSLFTIGLQVGLSLAILGAAIEYFLARRRSKAQVPRQLPGCLLYMAGALALTGIVAILGSIILRGSIVPALWLGAGVLGGFYLGFAILFLLYLLAKSIWPNFWD